MAIDQAKLDALLHQFVLDLGATVHAANVVIGDKLGLYKTLAELGLSTPGELAAQTGIAERYLAEWLAGQAAGGYLGHDPADGRYHLSDEQAFALADESSPAFVPGAFQLAAASVRDEPVVTAAVRAGVGMGWHLHNDEVFQGCERFFRPGYAAHLVESWIPALDGVHERLLAGARVADVGCGHGACTLLLAEATASRTTSTRWAAPSTGSRRCCACPTRCRSRSASPWGRRPARPACVRSPPRWGSPGSAAPPRPPSTTSTRPDRSAWSGCAGPVLLTGGLRSALRSRPLPGLRPRS